MTRHFAAWCERCATRVSLATEETEDVSRNVDALTPGADLQSFLPCPACEGQLRDLDDLTARREVPGIWPAMDEADVHRQWRERLASTRRLGGV